MDFVYLGASQEDISKYNFMDDSSKGIEIELKIENEQYNKILYVGGRQVHETSYKLGVVNDGSFEGVKYQVRIMYILFYGVWQKFTEGTDSSRDVRIMSLFDLAKKVLFCVIQKFSFSFVGACRGRMTYIK